MNLRNNKTLIGIVLCIVLAGAGWMMLKKDNVTGRKADLLYSVKRGDLVIDILESGSIEAGESLDIKSMVEGRTSIISVVPEGTIITKKDIEEKKVLVELDASDLKKREVQDEISLQSANANYTEAKENFSIQIKQNESDLMAGELKLKFAKMDIEKQLGEDVAELYIQNKIQDAEMLVHEKLGGESLKRRKDLENKIDFAKEEAARAKTKLEWTQKLEAKGYVTHDELLADEFALKRKMVELEQSEIDVSLYNKYEFRKTVQKLRSDYKEAIQELERIKARNRSKLSQSEARLKSAEAKLERQTTSFTELEKQIENCKIYATKEGMIVYGGGNSRRNSNIIEPGAQVHERQVLLTIPDTSTMIAKTQVHESMVSQVKKGLRAKVTIDALQKLSFEGIVKKVGILPDYQNRWLNPNLKVYSTEISIDGSNKNLKPGMSVQTQIIITEMKDVLYIPVHSTTTEGEQNICFVKNGAKVEKRNVEIGEYNDEFIEVKDGLKEGESIIINIDDYVKDEK